MKPIVQRPVGVTLSAVLLGLFSALFVVFGLGSLLIGVFAKGLMSYAPPAGGPPPPAGMMTGILVAGALLYFALAAWGISTIVGLVRMKMWARISTIVIGSGLALFSLLGVAGTAMGNHMLATQQIPMPGGDPSMLHTIMTLYEVFWILVALIGIALIVYFALPKTGAAFRAAALPPVYPAYGEVPGPYGTEALPPGYIYGQAPPPQAAFQAQDFHYAQPLPPAAQETAPNEPDETKP